MGKPNQRKLAKQKKKQKQEVKKRSAARESTIQPYAGAKYRNEEYVRLILDTETGILEAFELSGHAISDHAVDDALCDLVVQLRRRHRHELEITKSSVNAPAADGDLIRRNILVRWEIYFAGNPEVTRDELIGVLRTILHSVRVRKSASPASQGYLNYLVGFLAKLGVTVQQIDAGEDQHISAVEELAGTGRIWIEGRSPEAREEFFRLSQDILDSGHPQAVIEACQSLLRDCPPGISKADLATEMHRAEKLLTAGNPS